MKDKIFAFFISISMIFAFASEAEADLSKKKNIPSLIYWHGDEGEKKVALTFDDGPNAPYTPGVLKVLKEHNVKATFFVIGKYAKDYPHITKTIVEEGHAIGNHTYSHPDLRFMFNDSIRREIKEAEDIILETTGLVPFLFRPPYGAHNGRIIEIAEEMGYVTILYSLSGSEGGKKVKPDKIINRILKGIRSGSIVLIHDGDRFTKEANRKQSLEALPAIIESLKQQGYELVTVPELLNLRHGK